MDRYTLYMTLPSPDFFPELCRRHLPKFAITGNLRNGFITLTRKKLFSKVAMTFAVMSPELDDALFQRHIDETHALYSRIETNRPEVKEKLLQHLRVVNAAATVEPAAKVDEAALKGVMGMVDEVGGLFSPSPGLMLTGRGKVVMAENGRSEMNDYTITAPSELLDQFVKHTPDGEKRKEANNTFLTGRNIPVCPSLPPIVGEEHMNARSQEEVARRAVGILMTAIYAEELRNTGLDVEACRDFINKVIADYQAEGCFSPGELAFMANPAPDMEEDVYRYIWRYECFWAALWAMGFTNDLGYPDGICDVREMTGYLKECGTAEEFARRARLRSVPEILDQADLIYRLDWACVDARIKGQEAPADLNPGVVLERHRFLNWMIRYFDQEWDEVRTDT